MWGKFVMNFGNFIREKRIQKKLTLNNLAEKAEISASYLSLIERELKKPSLSSLEKISEALEVDMVTLISYNGLANKGHTIELQDVILASPLTLNGKKLNYNEKRALLNIIKNAEILFSQFKGCEI